MSRRIVAAGTRAPKRSERWADDWPRLMAPEEVEVADAVTVSLMWRGVDRRRSVRLLRMVPPYAISIQRGGKGSGHFDHLGRPGQVGGSLPSVGSRIIIEAKVQASDASLYDLDDSTRQAMTAWTKHEPQARARMRSEWPNRLVPTDAPYETLNKRERAASWKATVSLALAEQLGISASLASEVLAQWAHTSCDETYSALLLQHVAGRLFGAPMQDWAADMLRLQARERVAALRQLEQPDGQEHPLRILERAAEAYPYMSPDLRNITERTLAKWVSMAGRAAEPESPSELEEMATRMRGGRTEEQFLADTMRATYAATQRLLTEWGVDGVVVYRGVGLFDGETGSPVGTDERLGGNPLQSWTLDPTVAQTFAKKGPAPPGATREDGVVYAAYVPRERIFSLPFTGPGCLREREVVIIGGPGERRVVWRQSEENVR